MFKTTLTLFASTLLLSACAVREPEEIDKRYLAQRDCRGEVQSSTEITISTDSKKPVSSTVKTACVPPELDNKSEYEKNKEWENRDKLRNPQKR